MFEGLKTVQYLDQATNGPMGGVSNINNIENDDDGNNNNNNNNVIIIIIIIIIIV
jgi:hypothetical protein